MKEIIILYPIFIAFNLLEIFFIDPFLWKHGKDDKPLSSIIYVSAVCLLSLSFEFWFGVLIGLCSRALFDPVINLSGKLPSGKRKVCYHSTDHKRGFALAYEKFFITIGCKAEIILRTIWFFIPIIYLLSL